jgi:hypothetical protein
MSPYISASFRLIYPEDLTSVPGRADVEAIIFLRVYKCREALYFLTDMWIKNLVEKCPAAVSQDLIL